MKVTVILKNFNEQFYNGFSGFVGLLNMDNQEKFEKLKKMHHEKRVSMKIGNGAFNNSVELNQILRDQQPQITFKLEDRRGYKLATFEVTKR